MNRFLAIYFSACLAVILPSDRLLAFALSTVAGTGPAVTLSLSGLQLQLKATRWCNKVAVPLWEFRDGYQRFPMLYCSMSASEQFAFRALVSSLFHATNKHQCSAST